MEIQQSMQATLPPSNMLLLNQPCQSRDFFNIHVIFHQLPDRFRFADQPRGVYDTRAKRYTPPRRPVLGEREHAGATGGGTREARGEKSVIAFSSHLVSTTA